MLGTNLKCINYSNVSAHSWLYFSGQYMGGDIFKAVEIDGFDILVHSFFIFERYRFQNSAQTKAVVISVAIFLTSSRQISGWFLKASQVSLFSRYIQVITHSYPTLYIKKVRIALLNNPKIT